MHIRIIPTRGPEKRRAYQEQAQANEDDGEGVYRDAQDQRLDHCRGCVWCRVCVCMCVCVCVQREYGAV